MSETIVTGTDILRRTMAAWGVKLNTASMAQDVGVSSSELDAFTSGKLNLKPDVLKALVKILYQGHAIYDAEIDRLRMAPGPEPTSMGIRPDPYVPPAPDAGAHKYGGPPNLYPPDKNAKPVKTTRPGWAD